MFEIFLNPVNMIAGGALISSPIIIHLINRMRYKRMRWAAMEFLLKSQKRNRRRLIIEQMILLALRILLVLLTGLLLARLGSALGFFHPKNTLHVVILDDRLSMSDHWKAEDGTRKNSFDVAKDLILKEIAQKAAPSRSGQRLVIKRLSNPAEDLYDRRLNDEALKELDATLAGLHEPSFLHLQMADGIKAARDLFAKPENAEDEHVLHLVSDFRLRHWSEPEATGLNEALNSLKGVKINLVDTAHPVRGQNQKDPLYHDNLGIVQLRPETRVAAEGMPVQFTVGVGNYSSSERKGVRVTVKVDGEERPEGSLTMLSVPPGIVTEQTFQVGFVRPANLKPGQPYFAVITANLENEEAGLQADNTRYAVVEVRKQVPVLLVDGDPAAGDKPGGDSFHLRAILGAAKSYEIVRGSLADLERPTLEQFPSIYLLNIRELNDKALKGLDHYVRQGGSVAWFMGDRVNADFYNKNLYAGGKGLFPAPLADRPTREPSEEEQARKVGQMISPNPPFQVFLREESKKHPIFQDVYKARDLFRFLTIGRYFPVPRPKWNPEARKTNDVVELATLPNERPIGDYEADARAILESLPLKDPKYEKYRTGLEHHRDAIRESLNGKELSVLGLALDNLLQDPGDQANPDRPSMVEFWSLGEARLKGLFNQVSDFRDRVQFGDPLVIAGRYGQGRTVAFLTTAGQAWNNWAGGPALASYAIVMPELQKYLTSLEGETDRTVGTPLEMQLDSARYEPHLHRSLLQEARESAAPKPEDAPAQKAGLKDLGDQSGAEAEGALTFLFEEGRLPGVYLFDLVQRPEPGAEPRTETRAAAFNVDTPRESNLKRAGTPELEKIGKLYIPGGPPIVEPRSRADLSESAWIFLLFLIVLAVEQALAVRLSFHLQKNEAPAGNSAPLAA